ncbi:MAG: hypothetical protein RL685_3566 [Pseudomonadota bacterium]
MLASCTTDARSVAVGTAEARADERVAGDDGAAMPAAPPEEPSSDAQGGAPSATAIGSAALPTAAPPAAAPATEGGCSDGVRGAGEACDDGNQQPGDGCSADCSQIEPGYLCEEGQVCVQVEVCGDALLELGETCDDGNTIGGDGCAPSCRLERSYTCPDAGLNCLPSDRCGDGILAPREQCDDGNRTPGDGCTATCQIEQGWICPGLGLNACEPVCGDGITLGREFCDDGNTTAGDGCGVRCTVEDSFLSICGDAQLAPSEPCDDAINDGAYGHCANNCDLGPRCGDGEVAAGFEECDQIDNNSSYHNNPEACAPGCVRPWHCGDGVVDGTQDEECDDGINDGAYGGCTPQCLLGPRCGDARVTDSETCDDGNRRNGDGCNLACRTETVMSSALLRSPGTPLMPAIGGKNVDGRARSAVRRQLRQ